MCKTKDDYDEVLNWGRLGTTHNHGRKGILEIAMDHGRDRGLVGPPRDYGRKGSTVARIEDHGGEMELWEKQL